MVSMHARGIFTTTEAVAHVLDILIELIEPTSREHFWKSLPENFQSDVLSYIRAVGPGGVPRAWALGDPHPDWQALQTARRQAVAAELIRHDA